MPICIAGMHRSGTSMVVRLLNLCGLDLGPADQLIKPAPDNPEGFWESVRFFQVNDELLRAFGGQWNLPPELPAGWEHDERTLPWRERAVAIPAELNLREPWGWKDPRSSVTLPFWRSLWPELRVVACVRHPLAVACSLLERDRIELITGLRLWFDYYRRLLDALPQTRVVTHYEAYFVDPLGELRRVAQELALPVEEEQLQQACATVAPKLRHTEFERDDLERCGAPAEISELYARLCNEAGPRSRDATQAPALLGALKHAIRTELLVEKQQRRIEELEVQVIAQHDEWLQARDAMQEHIRALEETLAARRHRYADAVARVASRLRLSTSSKR